MDYFSQIIGGFAVYWWLVPVVLIISFSQSPWFKGLLGEFLVKLTAKLRLPANTYHRVHNVTLPAADGTTQIDHIFVSRYGIFVVETKYMKGWVFGGEKQSQWTQKLYRKSYKFQNPLRQNYKHLKALESALGLSPDVIHSVIVFAGDSTFKSPMPANVTCGGGYITYIKSFTKPVLSEASIHNILSKIGSLRLKSSWKTDYQHVQNLRARYDSAANRQCPKCGGSMVLRIAKRGATAGNEFWGCSAYPKCKTVQNVTK
ncbi:nuclease-related domain-containing protein [Kangiella geojedonensis]|uniref:NERD nuclease n=1 Tax=Kangiella geojedonensis TaxID=914150 RepID=A0A0F6RD11_9GAMM|nr:NERD domain-containing protein [Kangiella geojedonensis]AKE52521.1 NERD nuclease [Kangiella geojedonensis]